MRARWLPVGVLAAVLFAIIAVLLGALAFVRARREPVARWLPDLAVATGIALLLTILVGPFISGATPFAGGAGDFFNQVWLYAAFAGGGLLIGYLFCTAFGLDYRSQGLKRFAEARLSKPRRVVRR